MTHDSTCRPCAGDDLTWREVAPRVHRADGTGPPAPGERVEVWTGEHLHGFGRLVGWLHRERTYLADTPHFEVGADYRAAVRADDVALPVVAGPDGRFLPEYPRCPDCGGRIEWAEAGRVAGSRRCAGDTEPDLPAAGMAADPPGVSSTPAGCGSTFVDTRFGWADELDR